ncbi:MAG: hypothetical protein ACR2PX_21855 [Endozoicomonas sp.]|uniref:hypothetical protein n=1 Tax=Endozoicomonas sp. TaxID=1892382 RepID=UPI003D9B8C7F
MNNHSGGRGHRFESYRVRHTNKKAQLTELGFFVCIVPKRRVEPISSTRLSGMIFDALVMTKEIKQLWLIAASLLAIGVSLGMLLV